MDKSKPSTRRRQGWGREESSGFPDLAENHVACLIVDYSDPLEVGRALLMEEVNGRLEPAITARIHRKTQAAHAAKNPGANYVP